MTRDSRRSGSSTGPDRDRAGHSDGFARRWRYRFDLALSRGPVVVIGWLALMMLGVIVVSASILTVLNLSGINGGGGLRFDEAFWQSLLRVLDTGTFASDRDWPTRVLSLVVTLSGIFLAGSLIGLIANAVDQRIERLGKGRSLVLEHNHTLVLGWSPRLPSILAEIVEANSNHKGRNFVVLADCPKEQMEDELKRLVPDTRTTRVVCRTGDVGDVNDLKLVNVEDARSVIVLATESGDAGVIKTVLALRSIDPEFSRIRVVAEMSGEDTAITLREVTNHRVATVRADDVIAQVTAQACHQGGLAAVFRDLLDFDGDEIYFTRVPETAGVAYAHVQLAFENASVIGICRNGVTRLNPPPHTVVEADDEIIAVAQDDDTVLFTGFRSDVRPDFTARDREFAERRQRIAIIGWSGLGVTVIEELDRFLTADSLIDILVDRALFDSGAVSLPPTRCRLAVHGVSPGAIPLIRALDRADYDQAIVLGYRDRMSAGEADARSMLTLLAMQRAWAGSSNRPRVVAEMLDRSSVPIAQTTSIDDFVISDELSSLMMAQLSERLDLQDVFGELFAPEGSFVSLHPAHGYTSTAETTFAHVVATAAARGASALGYRIGNAPVVLNPPKSTPLRFGPNDQVLVLAQRSARQAEPVVFPPTPVSTSRLDGDSGPVRNRITERTPDGDARHRAALPPAHLSQPPGAPPHQPPAYLRPPQVEPDPLPVVDPYAPSARTEPQALAPAEPQPEPYGYADPLPEPRAERYPEPYSHSTAPAAAGPSAPVDDHHSSTPYASPYPTSPYAAPPAAPHAAVPPAGSPSPYPSPSPAPYPSPRPPEQRPTF
ncbi:CASTOR/POLLUX-related putative ion channel [Jatrophihabitans fulvus]